MKTALHIKGAEMEDLTANNQSKAASILGRMARGVPKTLSDAERQRRRDAMLAIHANRKAKKQDKSEHSNEHTNA